MHWSKSSKDDKVVRTLLIGGKIERPETKLKQRRLMEHLISVYEYLMGSLEEIGPDLSQWFLVKEQKAMGLTAIQEMPFKHWKKTLFDEDS